MSRSSFEQDSPVQWTRNPRGYYVYKGAWDERTAMIYGGAKDPEGQRQYVAARYSDLRTDTRRNSHRHLVEEHKAKRNGN